MLLHTKLSPHLQKLVDTNSAMKKQFIPSQLEFNQKEACDSFVDPLLEEDHTVCRGMVHKYPNRVLVLLTLNCAAYCRFCTRRRKVSDVSKGIITDVDITNMEKYLISHSEINEIVFSGGDPLTVPTILKKVLKRFCRLPQIKVIRVGTRLHLSNPKAVDDKVLDALRIVKKQPLYLMVHFEHPAEINTDTIEAIKRLQSVATMLLSQSVSLKGVNDSVPILEELFTRLVQIGVKPYYFFRCDLVRGTEHFMVDFKKERKIFTALRSHLSGLATPLYVIDAPDGNGKIPVPLDYWDFSEKYYRDFKGKKIAVK